MMFENIYFTAFTVVSLIPALFLLISGLSLFSIKDRSPATFHLAASLLLYSTVPMSYLTYSYYGNFSAYTRWVSAYIPLGVVFEIILFFLNYPYRINDKVLKTITYSGWSIILIGWVFFIYATQNFNTIYQFNSHYWDMDAEDIQAIVARFILVMVALLIVAGIWRAIKVSGKIRWVILAMVISFMIITVVPAVANLRSREGIISRDQYMLIYCILTVIGFFFVIILYINNTKDNTSVLAKIVSISLLTLFLLLQFVANISFFNIENAFDNERKFETALIANNLAKNDRLVYLNKFTIKDGIHELVFKKLESKIQYEKHKEEYINSYFLKELLDKKNLEDIHNYLLNNSFNSIPYFIGYKEAFLLEASNWNKKDTLESDILKFADNLDKKLRYYSLKFAKLKEDPTIHAEILKVFDKRDIPEVQPFKKAILAYLTTTADTPDKIKLELQNFISPMRPEGSRFYLEESETKRHFISYYYADIQNGFVYEAVYDYLYYREYIHPEARKFILMMIFVTVFIVVGFRFFFLGALITPLNTLLSGLREIKKGNLNVKLKVKVEDEIGFLTKSFNGMASSIKASKKRLQTYADELEDKVKERTAELTKTLGDVQALKTQQDGDYFLTSLLIKPLGQNYSKSEKVKVEFLISQKKTFKFKKWEEEIGGDICISYNLLLKNKPVTVFLNADAMGKSMQGAGGAIVVGSVFQSIIERTKLNQDVSDTYPEVWLKNAFLELHKVFESFNGSMLVSTVMGVVEEDTGFMYYINAEHPFTILYRDGKANFIETMMHFRKLGTLDITGKIFINTFQMKPEDTIIVGSDGRDDVMLGVDEYGNRIINEDETWFLTRIEEANGIISAVYDKMKSISEITDDLSLIKITYMPEQIENALPENIDKVLDLIHQSRIAHSKKKHAEAISLLEEAYSLNKNDPDIVRRLINNYIYSKDYSKAAHVGLTFSELNPSNIDYLYVQSYCLKKIGSLGQAAEIGERIRLRNPAMINNLSNLSEIYLLLKNFSRAKRMALKALEIDPNHKRALKILHYLEAKTG